MWSTHNTQSLNLNPGKMDWSTAFVPKLHALHICHLAPAAASILQNNAETHNAPFRPPHLVAKPDGLVRAHKAASCAQWDGLCPAQLLA